MSYAEGSIEGRLLLEDPLALAEVARWIAAVIVTPRFYCLREEWVDLHQEVLARVIESLRTGRFDSARDFQAYVRGVARYTAMESLTRRRRVERAGTAGISSGWAPDDPEGVAISHELVGRVLALATADCRRLFRMYFMEQKSYGEIAVKEGAPIGTVKSRLFRCLEAVHRAIVRETRR